MADAIPPAFPHVVAPPVTPLADLSAARRRPSRVLGLAGTNAAFLVPDHIRKKFVDGWTVHVPLTFLTDKGCLLKNKLSAASTHEVLSMDPSSGQIIATSKPLFDSGELDLTFDEWHQVWRRLLDLIKTYLPLEFPLWEIHYTFILNNNNRAEIWPLYVSYDVEIRKRAVVSSIDPSVFSIGIWNNLEVRYNAKKVLAQVQSSLKQFTPVYNTNIQNSRQERTNTSFRGQQNSDNSQSGRCIFCGNRSKDHPSKECIASTYANGSPSYMQRQEPSGVRWRKSGRRHCFSWNGLGGCEQGSTCKKGDHCCTLCGSLAHTAQQCDVVA